MNPFTYSRATDANHAVAAIAGHPHGKFLGGGTNLIDLMKMGVETPNELVDVTRLPLAQIEELPDKRERIGALARNSDVAEHELIKTRYLVLSEALISGRSSHAPRLNCATWLPWAAISCSGRVVITFTILRSPHAINAIRVAVAAPLTGTIAFMQSLGNARNASPT